MSYRLQLTQSSIYPTQPGSVGLELAVGAVMIGTHPEGWRNSFHIPTTLLFVDYTAHVLLWYWEYFLLHQMALVSFQGVSHFHFPNNEITQHTCSIQNGRRDFYTHVYIGINSRWWVECFSGGQGLLLQLWAEYINPSEIIPPIHWDSYVCLHLCKIRSFKRIIEGILLEGVGGRGGDMKIMQENCWSFLSSLACTVLLVICTCRHILC